MVLPQRFELWTSPLPRECSTPELRQRALSSRRLSNPWATPWPESGRTMPQRLLRLQQSMQPRTRHSPGIAPPPRASCGHGSPTRHDTRSTERHRHCPRRPGGARRPSCPGAARQSAPSQAAGPRTPRTGGRPGRACRAEPGRIRRPPGSPVIPPRCCHIAFPGFPARG
jgi:hypothetical protein